MVTHNSSAFYRAHHKQLEKKYAKFVKRQYSFTNIGATVIIHFHVPKCSGTSINEAFFGALPHLDQDIALIRSNSQKNFASWTHELASPTLKLTDGRITYIEFHPLSQSSSFMDVANILPAIRKNFQQKNGRIFAFTVVRNPVTALRSYYSYKCMFKPNKYCRTAPPLKTYENFQLNYLATSQLPFRDSSARPYVSTEQVPYIMSTMETTLDHVGLTEYLNDTIHALQDFMDSSILNPEYRIKLTLEHSNVLVGGESKPAVLPNIEVSQVLDILLYQNFLTKYLKQRESPQHHRGLESIFQQEQNIMRGLAVGLVMVALIIAMIVRKRS